MRNQLLLLLCLPCAFAQTHFHHAHLNSADPTTAMEFYATHLSAEKAPVKALYGGQWKGRTQFASPRGRVFDHIAVSVDNLDQTLAGLRDEGVKALTAPRTVNGIRSAFVQAPDNVELEIVEGHPKR